MDARKFYSQRARYLPELKVIVKENPSAELVETSPLFCTADTCSMIKNGVLNYLDLNHLNVNGSTYISAQVAKESKLFCSTLGKSVRDPC
jgi:hypothetical protein